MENEQSNDEQMLVEASETETEAEEVGAEQVEAEIEEVSAEQVEAETEEVSAEQVEAESESLNTEQTDVEPSSDDKIKAILQAAIFSAEEALPINRLSKLFHGDSSVDKKRVQTILNDMLEDELPGLVLTHVASGYRYQVKQDYAEWVLKLYDEKPPRYSRAAMETLALIAYKQPITRAEIEEIRGVAVSTSIITTLQERDWVKAVGHRDTPGKPALYATTKTFLDYFSLQTLNDLPDLAAMQDMEKFEENLLEQLELDVAELDKAAAQQPLSLVDKLAEDGDTEVEAEQELDGDSETDTDTADIDDETIEEADYGVDAELDDDEDDLPEGVDRIKALADQLDAAISEARAIEDATKQLSAEPVVVETEEVVAEDEVDVDAEAEAESENVAAVESEDLTLSAIVEKLEQEEEV